MVPKTSAKFDRGHPLRGRRMQVGWVKIGDFRQITGYISKTVDRRLFVYDTLPPTKPPTSYHRRLSTNNRLYLENGTR